MKYITEIGEQEFLVEILDEQRLLLNDRLYQVDFVSIGDQSLYSLLLDGKSYEAYVYPAEQSWQVLLQGRLYPAQVAEEREKLLRAVSGAGLGERAEYHLQAPMPGLVIAVPVSEGQEVHRGDILVVLESMKMQNELRSPSAGTVSSLRVKAGDNVEPRQTLLIVVKQ
ncbi:MAG: biotin/lipoyl-binding protein [Anaerolineales bacterium]|nr:biotin/lipoyl-binding protein [Anaerolineales bacterium]